MRSQRNYISVCVIQNIESDIKQVERLLQNFDELVVIGTCLQGVDAVDFIIEKEPDIVIIDAHMTHMNGFEIITHEAIRVPPLFVFTHHTEEYAKKAFDHNAIDYLIKPIHNKRFYNSIHKALNFFNNRLSYGNVDIFLRNLKEFSDEMTLIKNQRMPLKLKGKIIFIDKLNIEYIKSSRDYAEIFSQQKKYVIRESLSTLIEDLKAYDFIRIHRSTIINISFVKEVIFSDYGEVDVKMQSNEVFRISRSFKDNFKAKMNIQ